LLFQFPTSIEEQNNFNVGDCLIGLLINFSMK